jgi:hypothetical protein
MSDALSEIERDHERAQRLIRLKDRIEIFKINPTENNREKVIEAAIAVDEVRGGFWLSRRYHTHYRKTIEAELDQILQGP